MWLHLVSLLWLISPVDLSALNECHRAARARDHRVGGDFEVRLTLQPNGGVTGLSIRKNTSGNEILERCVRYNLKKMFFPGRKDSLTLRFSFPSNLPQFVVWAQDVAISRTPGNGAAARVLLHPGSVRTKNGSLSIVRVEKNGRLVQHVHQKTDIFFSVLEGTGRLEVWTSAKGSRFHPLSAGTSGFVPAGLAREITGPSGEEPLVLLFWTRPAGVEQFFLHGNSRQHDFHLFPPKNSSESPPATRFDRLSELKIADTALPKGEPRRVEKITLVSVPGIGELVRITAPAAVKVQLDPPPKGEMFAFLGRGGGELTLDREQIAVQPGSGWFLPKRTTYVPGVKNAPFFLIAFCSNGICSAR